MKSFLHSVFLRNKRQALIILALVFLGSFAKPVSALQTWSDIRTEIRVRIKDTSTSRQRYTDTQLLNMANQTQRDVVNFVTWMIQTSSAVQLVSGTTCYAMPSNFMATIRVTLNNRRIPETTQTALDSQFNYAAWERTGGLPSTYFEDPSQPQNLCMYPFPNSASSTGTLNVIYYARPTDFSADSDTPFNAVSRYAFYEDVITYGVVYQVFLVEGDMAKMTEYKTLYETRVKQIMDLLNKKPDYIPGVSGPNPR